MSRAPERRGEGRSALVLGATGLVGSKVLDLLLSAPLYDRVVSITRSRISNSNPRLEQHVIAFPELESVLNSVVVDDVYCCLGTTMKKAGSQSAFRQVDYDYPLLAAKVLRQKSEHFLLVSALGANSTSRFFYNRLKGQLEADLMALGFPFLTVVRPSLLIGERRESRFIESAGIGLAKLVGPLMSGPFARYAAVEADAVAQALIREGIDSAERRRAESVRIIESESIGRQSESLETH